MNIEMRCMASNQPKPNVPFLTLNSTYLTGKTSLSVVGGWSAKICSVQNNSN